MKSVIAITAVVSIFSLTGCDKKPAAAMPPATTAPSATTAAGEVTIIVQDRPMPKPREKKPGNF